MYAYTLGVQRIPGLAALLDDFDLQYRRNKKCVAKGSVLAWGLRPSALRAQRYAKRHNLGIYYIEDGFLRSIGLGKDDPPLSIVLDGQGLYLDASRPTQLETLIKQPLSLQQTARVQALIQAWREGRVSKYNHSNDLTQPLPKNCVLVTDQTYGDASVVCGQATEKSFARMLDAALIENPQSVILLKVHPDVISGRKKGYFDLAAVNAMARVQVMDADVHPASLMQHVKKVYVVTSQLGFEALLWGVPVRVFGMPFYAGWGLTQDELPGPARRMPVSIEQLAHAALIGYSRYIDPGNGRRCEVETVLAWLALQRQLRSQLCAGIPARRQVKSKTARWPNWIARIFREQA